MTYRNTINPYSQKAPLVANELPFHFFALIPLFPNCQINNGIRVGRLGGNTLATKGTLKNKGLSIISYGLMVLWSYGLMVLRSYGLQTK